MDFGNFFQRCEFKRHSDETLVNSIDEDRARKARLYVIPFRKQVWVANDLIEGGGWGPYIFAELRFVATVCSRRSDHETQPDWLRSDGRAETQGTISISENHSLHL